MSTPKSITVSMRNGSEFVAMKLPDFPFEIDGFVSFWFDESTIRTVPLVDVLTFDIHME